MTTEALGTVRSDGELRAVRHIRHFDAPPDAVWAALTEPGQVKNWLAEMTIEARVGGRVTFVWETGDMQEGEVRVFDPPSTFEYTWAEGPPSVVRFELSADGGGTRLVLEHSRIQVDSAAGIGAGWHSHLDAMEALVGGSPQTFTDWHARYEELLPDYQQAAAL